MNDREIRRLMRLARHIDNVRNYCNILGQRLAENGEAGLGHGLIANGYIHDNSKFHGVEWLYRWNSCHAQTLFSRIRMRYFCQKQ